MADPNPTPPAEKSKAPTKMKVIILRDYWPKDQTHPNPDPLTTNEVRLVAAKEGEPPTIAELPQDEAMDLIELGAAKQYRGA